MKWLVRFMLVVVLVACVTAAAGQENLQEHAPTAQRAPEGLLTNGVVQQAPPKPGEVCTVCEKPVKSGDLVYLVDGQRIAVHAGECDAALRAHPQRWLARLAPKGGAFLGTDARVALTSAWLYSGLYVVVGLIFAALCAQRSLRTGYSPGSGLLLGLVFNVLGYLFVITRPNRGVKAPAGVPPGLHKIPTTYEPQPCPKCGDQNHPSATRCLGCGSALAPRIGSEVEKVGLC